MSNWETLSYFLDFEYLHNLKRILLLHKKYTREVLKSFNMKNCNTTPTLVITNTKLIEELDDKTINATLFKEIVGSLKFLCNNRPYISYGVWFS